MSVRSKVSFAACREYSRDMRPVLKELLTELGGIGAFVAPGQSVLIKPNLLTSRAPEQAVTTHPELIRALVRMVRDHGAVPAVGDSPTSVTKLEQVWEQTGFRRMCDEEDVPLLNLDAAGSTQFELNGVRVGIACPVLEADVLITVPKVKTHVLTVYTGAVKNLYGTLPGYQKATLHKTFPKPGQFGELIASIYGKLRPRLAIADGVVGMDGDGPSGGRPVGLGFLAASADGVALDAAVCRLLGIRIEAVPYFKGLNREKLGAVAAADIELAGTPLEELAPADFRLPSTLVAHLIPGWLVQIAAPFLWIRPAFTADCSSCGRCVKACSSQALTIAPKQRPVVDPERCIGCCCCHEVCPESAVRMTQSPLLSFLRRGRLP